MLPSTNIPVNRLALLQLAEQIGVSAACREHNISRTQFYVYRERYQKHGLEGLKNLPPVHHSHPMTTPHEVELRVLELSWQHPSWGCDQISGHFKNEGINISGVTIQKILNRHHLGSQQERWLRLEENPSDLSPEQLAFVEYQNSAFRDRNLPIEAPGVVTFIVFGIGHLYHRRMVYIHALIDMYSGFTYAVINHGIGDLSGKAYERRARPIFEQMGFKLTLLQKERGYYGTAERFSQIVKKEFYPILIRPKTFLRPEAISQLFNTWLQHYNNERPLLGFPNYGLTPMERIQEYLAKQAGSP